MSWVEKFRKINQRGGGGTSISDLRALMPESSLFNSSCPDLLTFHILEPFPSEDIALARSTLQYTLI